MPLHCRDDGNPSLSATGWTAITWYLANRLNEPVDLPVFLLVTAHLTAQRLGPVSGNQSCL